ncbi:hypothetical protein [Synoicihabitans lomoniglobus]|uniref:Uncharacterized protein n=1 Tax=Synoicihabitans lomoniglobus TaxID=2909285 RepID=A0AAF0A1F4_9BACT|nr:hypothetical protein [Opitutaceae bacterium LMO-M01]WED64972.1 hypothetical protein PXH66_21705 [Opitutaceae bacterium LMO-M01]
MMLSLSTSRLRSRHRALAGLLALTVLALGLFSVAPEMHDALHADGDHATHYCAVDMFAAGVALAATAVALRQVRLLWLGATEPVTRVQFIAPTWRLPPGRGPPASSALQ